MADRLDEIGYADYEVTEDDVQWLIAEVKRLRAFREELLLEYWNNYDPETRWPAVHEVILKHGG